MDYTFNAADTRLYVVVQRARIDEAHAGNPARREPIARVTTGTKYDDVEPVVVKVRGRAYTVDRCLSATRPLGWRPPAGTDARDRAIFEKTHGFHLTGGYDQGVRHAHNGAALSWETQASKTIHDLVYSVMKWLDTEHPEWRNLSIRREYEGQADRLRTQIEQAQQTITKAERGIRDLELLAEKFA